MIVFAVLVALVITMKLQGFGFYQAIQFKFFDTYQQIQPREYSAQPVKIVDIDEESLEKLGQWPWPRDILARLITKLQEAKVAAIALDIVFAEEDRTSPHKMVEHLPAQILRKNKLKNIQDNDKLFADAIAKGAVVNGFVLTEGINDSIPPLLSGTSYVGDNPAAYLPQYNGAIATLPKLVESAEGNGALNSIPDMDGVIRRVPLFYQLDGIIYPSLAAEALRVAQGAGSYLIRAAQKESNDPFSTGVEGARVGVYEVKTDNQAALWMHYTHYEPSRYLSAWKLLEKDYDASELEGHIVFVGTSAAGLKDIRSTPLNPVTNGVEVHAQAVEQILAGDFITRPDWILGAEILTVVFAGVVLMLLMFYSSVLLGLIFAALVGVGVFAASWFAYVEKGWLIEPITPAMVLLLVYIYESFRRYRATEQEKRQVRDAFSHYMSPAMLDKLMKNPDALKLGGEMREMTVLFSDIRGFTSISEQFDAEGLTQFMNDHLTSMTNAILENGGTIDKYMGDCIMAFWNAPLDDPDHADNTAAALLAMRETLLQFNNKQKKLAQEEGRKFQPIEIGIGLNTGNICVGNMGSEQRFDYSVLGDDVNLASRLEGACKQYGVDNIIGQATAEKLSDSTYIELDRLRVKGKTEPTTIYTILSDGERKTRTNFRSFQEVHLNMLKYYRGKEWMKAKRSLAEAREFGRGMRLGLSKYYTIFEQRIDAMEKAPPADSWDGVYDATEK
jgi:adenylate cyclase